MVWCTDTIQVCWKNWTEMRNYQPYPFNHTLFLNPRGVEQEVMERLLVLHASIIHWQPMRGWPFLTSVLRNSPADTFITSPGSTLAQCPQVLLKRQTSSDSMVHRENGRNNSCGSVLESNLLLLLLLLLAVFPPAAITWQLHSDSKRALVSNRSSRSAAKGRKWKR